MTGGQQQARSNGSRLVPAASPRKTLSDAEAGVRAGRAARKVDAGRSGSRVAGKSNADADPGVAVIDPLVVVRHDVAERIEDRLGAADAQVAVVAEGGQGKLADRA